MKKLMIRALIIIPVVLFLSECSFAASSEVIKKQLPNGLVIIVKSNPDSKVLGINILGKNRSAMEPDGKTGIADFTNRMLLKGTRSGMRK